MATMSFCSDTDTNATDNVADTIDTDIVTTDTNAADTIDDTADTIAAADVDTNATVYVDDTTDTNSNNGSNNTDHS